MITIKYIDPITQLETTSDIDESTTNVTEYIKNLHKNYLCKDICNGENCRVWLKRGDEYLLMGVQD
jgi:hypothetical protein